MAKYTVQTPDGSIVTVEGPDGATQNEIIQQAQMLYDKPQANQTKSAKEYVKDIGKATASLADMGINAVTGTLDWAAYPLARAYYGTQMGPEQAAQKAEQETTSPKDVIGRALGITQDPAYQNELSRQALGYVGENIGRSVVEPVSQVTGLPQQDIGNMLGTATFMAPGAGRMVATGVKTAAEPVINFGKGFARGVAYPAGASSESALAPIRPTYVPHEQVAEFMRGERPASTLTEVPSKPLYESTPSAKWAYGMAPENVKGEKLVPYAGRTAEGLGEQIGSQYRQNPITGLIDIGTTLATGIPAPITAIARTIPQIAAKRLQQATNFEPGFGAARDIALANEGRAGLQANMPTTQALPAPGPVAPTINMPGAPRTVNIEGQSFNLPYDINTSQSQAARPQPISPKQLSQQVAASKIQQPQFNIQGQDILAQIRARNKQPAPTPTVQPVTPTPLTESLPSSRWTPEEKLAIERERLKEQPPTEMSPREESQFKKELEQNKMTPEARGNIIKEWSSGNRLVPGEVLDTSKGAYGVSNLLHRQVQELVKAGIDEIPIIEGASNKQVIEKLHEYISNNKPDMFKTKKGKPSIESVKARAQEIQKKRPDVSQMLVGEETPKTPLEQSITDKKTFNSDLQRYRYGSSKDPLTMEEFNHLQNSDYIEKHSMWDSLKGIDPNFTEHSFWYKDKNGVTKNLEAWNGKLQVTEIDKKNPNKETTYTKDNPGDEDHWYFTKTQSENGVTTQVDRFEVKDTLSPRHEKLKDWPEEFRNSKYDYE